MKEKKERKKNYNNVEKVKVLNFLFIFSIVFGL